MKLVLDASAKPASGFMSGNNFWLGSSEQCVYVSSKIDFHLSTRFKRNTIPNVFFDVAPFEVEMRYVYVKHTSPTQGKYIGRKKNANQLTNAINLQFSSE